jgi:NADP-dependent 3-hydroxy acid dehydrogenase YdfG
MTDLLAGKTILITGASAGIGECAARLFAREGANLVLTARRLPELEQIAREIRDEGGDVLAVRADTFGAPGIVDRLSSLAALGRVG